MKFEEFASNKQLHSQIERTARRAWQLQNIMGIFLQSRELKMDEV